MQKDEAIHDAHDEPAASEVIDASEASLEEAPEPEPGDLDAARRLQVTDGQRLLGQGRSAEALALAEGVLAEDPAFAEAWALKGDCLERQGEAGAALAAYRRIEELGAATALDRIRLAQLEKAAEFEQFIVEEEAPKRGLIIAVAASVLALSLAGIAFFMASQPQATTAGRSGPGAPAPAYNTFEPIAPAPQAPARNENESDGREREEAGGPIREPAGSQAVPDRSRVNGSSRPLEDAGTGYQPLNPMTGAGTQAAGNGAPAAPPAGGSPSQPAPDFESRAEDAAPAGPAPIIEIRPSQSSGAADSESAGDVLSADALVRKARDAYLVGNYSQAADAYEQALRMGASPGSTNQRLAQCYENLGQRQSAIRAYERAVAAYERSRNRGQGDSSVLDASLEACRAALRRLRG
jgi:tetratricopeptide (TPR) repeat protein